MPELFNPAYNLIVRGNYPHKRTILTKMRRHLEGREEDSLEGALSPVVEIHDDSGHLIGEQEIRDIDIPFLCQNDLRLAHAYFELLQRSFQKDKEALQKIDSLIHDYVQERAAYFAAIPRKGSDHVVPCTCKEKYSLESVSDKGATLLELSSEGYPVPDFSILTSGVYNLKKMHLKQRIEEAISQLESLTALKLGSSENPLILALRCAMPCYMPGVMPTYLNVGVTEEILPALIHHYGKVPAYKMALNNFRNLLYAKHTSSYKDMFPTSHLRDEKLEDILEKTMDHLRRIDPALAADPYFQTAFLVDQSYEYYKNNLDLMLTFSKGEHHFPSIILQRMICTVRSEDSRVGVMYSRHPRTGVGMQIESAKNIFGEAIMAGSVETEKTNFTDIEEIKKDFPAVYRFLPALSHLEALFQSPVTMEFATDLTPRQEFFNLLQLNPSEMTGRSAFISVMDLYQRRIIDQKRVSELIKPYHIKQIESDAIDPDSFKNLTLFSSAASVLPRSAILAQMYFSAESALKHKKAGRKVCLCKESFEPSDTIIMGEVDAIVSMTSAAIHVVTICQSYGLPALLNLEKYGVEFMDEHKLENADGQEIVQGDWVTISSRNRCIYKGTARFKPARLIRHMRGEHVELEIDEVEAFDQMAQAYRQYNELISNLKLNQILSLTEIIRLVVLEFRGETEKAKDLVNSWFDHNSNLYVEGVFQSGMGDHLKQNTVFNLLTLDRKIRFFKSAVKKCMKEKRSGYSAGMFMLGRFICLPQPVKFWNSFNVQETSILLNEWLLFEKYMQILHDVGERKIRRAKEKILQEELSPLKLDFPRLKTLIPLKLSRILLEDVKKAMPDWCDTQTRKALDLLMQPYSCFYSYHLPWSIQELKNICAEARIPLPDPDST
jgi:hypothetical protein